MSASPNRRGLLRGLLAALFGWGAVGAAAEQAQPEAPPRCPHYFDGALWSYRPGRTGYYVRDTSGCPYCRPRGWPLVTDSTDSTRVTTYVYDARLSLVTVPMCVMTYTYDARPPQGLA
jgi:hypothetical protein